MKAKYFTTSIHGIVYGQCGYKHTEITFKLTNDNTGVTLSMSDDSTGGLIAVPIDHILKDIQEVLK